MSLRNLLAAMILYISLSSCVAPSPAISPVGLSPVSTPRDKISSVAVVLEKESPWKNPSHSVVVYLTNDKQEGFRVISDNQIVFDSILPLSGALEDIVFTGENSSDAKEVGIISSQPGDQYNIIVYNIKLGKFVPNSDNGEIAYSSAHYPPLLADLDNDTVPELVISYDDPALPEGFVNNRIYVLNNDTYTKSSFLILPPRELLKK